MIGSLIADLAAAKRIGGKSCLRQLSEIWWCKRNVRHFGVSDYFDHRLFLPERDRASMTSVAGWRMEDWLFDRLNPPKWQALAEDKILVYSVLDATGIPYPPILALFHPQGRSYLNAPTFADAESMAAHLRNGMSYPCFVKPVSGGVGVGAASLIGFDKAVDRIELGSGECIPTVEFCRRLERPQPRLVVGAGYIFQELVHQHTAVESLCGTTVSTVRAVVTVNSDEPVIHRTVWRVGVGTNMTDNFAKGCSGNLLAAIDPDDGKVLRVVRGYGIEQRIVDAHPDTGLSFSGFSLPHWDRVRDVCLRAARAFPMLKFQHWDIAFSPEGPLVLELNSAGSIDILQYASGQGLYDGSLQRLVEHTVAV